MPVLSPAVIEALKPLRVELVRLWTAPVLDLDRIAKVHVTIHELTGFATAEEHRQDAQFARWGSKRKA